MIAFRQSDFEETPAVRAHPYINAEYDKNLHYYNFRENPVLIKEQLEDYKPFDKHEAIQTFYRLLEWLNGDSSVFESNDCAFKPPGKNNSPKTSSKKLECNGRLMIIYRNLPKNLNANAMEWLLRATQFYLQKHDLSHENGVIGLCFMDTAFEELGKAIGRELVIHFWAFGDTEGEAYESLNRVFTNLLAALEGVSNEIIETIKEQAKQRKQTS